MENPIEMDDLRVYPYFWQHPFEVLKFMKESSSKRICSTLIVMSQKNHDSLRLKKKHNQSYPFVGFEKTPRFVSSSGLCSKSRHKQQGGLLEWKKSRALARNVPHINITYQNDGKTHRFKLLGRVVFKAPSEGTWSKLWVWANWPNISPIWMSSTWPFCGTIFW